MTTLTASSTIAIGESTPEQESVTITVLPLAAPGEGRGRLIHPTLGTFDYEFPPDRWSGLRTDLVVPPVWAVTPTLGGAFLAQWDGSIEDVEVLEQWEDGISMKAGDLDTLLSFWQSPPDPSLGVPSGYVQWWPSYATDLGFYVAILEVAAGSGAGVETTKFGLDEGWVEGSTTLRMRIVARVE